MTGRIMSRHSRRSATKSTTNFTASCSTSNWRIRNSKPPTLPSQRVGGAPIDGFETIRHAVPMMSLDNTYSQEEVRDFVDRVQKLLPGEPLEWLVEPKADGVAISLRFEDGLFTLGTTRGDGIAGDDVTANLRTIRTIPLRLNALDQADAPGVLEVRGEVIMTRSGFAQLNRERSRRRRASLRQSPQRHRRFAKAARLSARGQTPPRHRPVRQR